MRHAVAAFSMGLAVCFCVYPALLSVLVRLHAGQRVAAYGPSTHGAKTGTPTMGGVLFVVMGVAAWVVLDRTRSGFVLVFALVAGALIGLADDLANVRGAGALGLFGRQKLILQGVAGVLAGIGIVAVHATRQVVPLVGTVDFGVLAAPLTALAVIAASNAVNLTDGVDGLAATTSVCAFGALLVVALIAHAVPAVVVSAALLGGLIAFLAFNWYPARVFMGDTGALALGCVLAVISAELGLLWVLPLLGVVFVVETLSVIVNVTAVRRFHRRLLRASPLHHHFEEIGYREATVVLLFGAVALLAATLTVVWFGHSVPR